MSKYIRTKDGIIAFGKEYAYPTRIVKGNQHYIFTELTESTFEKMKDFNKWNIIAQADTIKELCDEFVVAYEDNARIVYSELDWAKTKANASLEVGHKSIIYGAVWCEFGLKYVAKMNDKGELELIWIKMF